MYGWTRAAGGPELASRFAQASEILGRIHSELPQADIAPVAAGLLLSLRKDIKKAPVFTERQLAIIRRAVSDSDIKLLDRYQEERKTGIVSRIDELLKGIAKKEYAIYS